MDLSADFFHPYLQVLVASAYYIQQALEGLEVVSSASNIDLGGTLFATQIYSEENLIATIDVLLICSAGLIFVSLVAGYTLGRWKGPIVTLGTWFIPGILSMFGLLSSVNLIPEVYVIQGTGFLGEPKGAFCLLIIGLIAGWSLIIIFTDIFSLGSKFQGIYDHIWYATAIIAALFFISDSGFQRRTAELNEENQLLKQVSMYLLEQTKDYGRVCVTENRKSSVSCVWAESVQQTLNNYAAHHPKIFASFGPERNLDVWAPVSSQLTEGDVPQLRREIYEYNKKTCPVEKIKAGILRYAPTSSQCQVPPDEFCSSYPELLVGTPVEEMRIYSRASIAIAAECIIPKLVRLKERHADLVKGIKENSRARHYRLFLIFFLSVIAGGKIANATSKAVALSERPDEEKKRIGKLLGKTFAQIARYCQSALVLLQKSSNTVQAWNRTRRDKKSMHSSKLNEDV